MSECDKCFGSQIEKIGRLNMCGGCADWWNYVLKFDDYDYTLYREDRNGLREIENVILYYKRGRRSPRKTDMNTSFTPMN